MPEYRAVRKQHSLLEICKKPELAAEVTITAAEFLGVDAARIALAAPTAAGTARHQNPTQAYNPAAAAQPAANQTIAMSMRWNLARTAGAWSGAAPRIRSTASSTTWVVLPVISVLGGRLPR